MAKPHHRLTSEGHIILVDGPRTTRWRRATGSVQAAEQFAANSLELGDPPFSYRPSPDGELVQAVLAAQMRRPEEVEAARIVFTRRLGFTDREAAETQQASLLRMQGQPELGEAHFQRLLKAHCLMVVLESQHTVVRVADHNHITGCVSSSPLIDPDVKDMVQVEIRQQR